MPVPSPWTAGAVHHITRWPRAQLSQHYRGVLLTLPALSGHWHPVCLRLPTIAVTRNSVSGLLQTTKGEIRKARILTREGTRWRSGATLEQSPLCPRGARSFFLHASLCCRFPAFGGENNLQVGSEQKELH